MLEPAEDVHAAYEPLPFRQGWLVLHVGARHYRMRRVDRAVFRALPQWAQETPQPIGAIDRRACWLFRGRYFWEGEGLSQAEVHARLLGRLATR